VGKTYFTLGADEAPEAWRAIRSMRAAPTPSLRKVLKQERAEVFHMALEQSQQQFAAAAGIGYESRPLNLFYGLSQAGRALAAASSRLGPKEGDDRTAWLPRGGHGLKFDVDTPTVERLLGEPVRLQAGKSDTFSRVSHALGSPLDFREETFGALLAQIPEVYLEFRTFEYGPVAIQPNGIYAGSPLHFPLRWDLEARGAPIESGDLTALREWVNSYPALAGLALEVDAEGKRIPSHNDGHLYLTVSSQDQLVLRGSQWLPAQSIEYRRSTALFPRLGNSSTAAHPIVIWWMVLFALSMLARYSPRDWSRLMSLRESRLASVLEHVLDTALDAVPNLIAEALADLNP